MHFKSRLQVVLVLFIASWMVLVVRLLQLQIVRGSEYRAGAEQRRLIGKRLLKPIRGRILDRAGRDLARDEPAWGVAVHYRLLRDDPDYHEGLARRRLRARHLDPIPADLDQARELLEREISRFWQLVGEWDDPVDLAERVNLRVAQIQAWRAHYLELHGLQPVAGQPVIREERECHTILDGLSKEDEIDIRTRQQDTFPFLLEVGAVEISDSTRRVYHNGQACAHLLGYLGEVDAKECRARPFVEDHDWGGYRIGDLRGRSGVESMAEDILRGERGLLLRFIDDRPPQRREPVSGDDVMLTLDAALQQQLFDLLRDEIAKHNEQVGYTMIPGGSIVVLDAPSRAVLGMVSYPSYDPNTFRKNYAELSTDLVGKPLIHKALAADCCPGSIVKPITVAAAHDAGVITTHSRIECQGVLNPGQPQAFRCWRPAGHSAPKVHGVIDGQGAIRGSCNVFCFKLANAMSQHFGGPAGAVEHMCDWLEHFGVGRLTGIGLRRRPAGILPRTARLRRSPLPADPRNFAIGQGEVEVTPLQAANIVATYAMGEWRAVKLLQDRAALPALPLPAAADVWTAIRMGMYEVVNDPDGTAPKARLKHPDFCLCGKSGSAETPRWPLRYRVRHGQTELVLPASSPFEARNRFMQQLAESFEDGDAAAAAIQPDAIETECIEWFPAAPPEAGRRYSHAWFVAFIQPKRGAQPDFSQPARVAIAVLLEFGGSGGTVAGPLCREVAETIIEDFPEHVRLPAEVAGARP